MKYFILIFLLIGNLLAIDFDANVNKRYVHNKFIFGASNHYDFTSSELTYKSYSFIYEFTGRFDIGKIFIEGTIPFNSKCLDGNGDDTDFLKNYIFYKSLFDVYTDMRRIDIGLGYKFSERFYLFMFYTWYDAEYLMENGELVIDIYPINIEYNDLESTYSLSYNRLGWGLGFDMDIIKRLNLSFKIKHVPTFDIYGKGYWNLRNLNFKHRGIAEDLYGNISASIDMGVGIKIMGGFYFDYIWCLQPTKNQFTENSEIYVDWDTESFSRGFWFGLSIGIF
jgi:hypothetical protein